MKENSKGSSFFSRLGTFLMMSNKAFLMVILLFVAIALSSEVFLSQTNQMNVLRQICVNVIVALGFTFVIGSGHVDLSVGSAVGFIGVVMAALMKFAGWPIGLAILAGFATGAIIGFINASLITLFDLPPFVVTIATQSVFRGFVYIVTKMSPITMLPERFIFIGQGYIFSIPFPVYIMAFMVVFMYFLSTRSIYGRHVIAVGGNKDAALASGISVVRTRMYVYITSGLCAALAACILTARTASAQLAAGNGMELDAIASVVMGGTAMTGGSMNIIGTLFGAAVIGFTSNGLNLHGVDSNYQIIAKGLLILLALVLDSVSTKFYYNLRKRRALQSLEENRETEVVEDTSGSDIESGSED